VTSIYTIKREPLNQLDCRQLGKLATSGPITWNSLPDPVWT